MSSALFLTGVLLLSTLISPGAAAAFVPTAQQQGGAGGWRRAVVGDDRWLNRRAGRGGGGDRTTALKFFDKVFEESGPLGKGITVGKVQVALQCRDRSGSSIFGALEKAANAGGGGAGGATQRQLAQMANDVCLALLRRSDEWVSACSDSKWFSQNDDTKAESQFNDWSNREAYKFEKEYIPGADSDEKGGGATIVVVSLVIEIEGDTTKFDGAGYSLSGTKDVLSSIASDCMVQGGECVNAVEIFWTPGERDEVLTSRDIVLDFPELIDL